MSRRYFTRIGNVAHRGKPASEYRLTYMQKLPQLAFHQFNWLLREHYDVYLWRNASRAACGYVT